MLQRTILAAVMLASTLGAGAFVVRSSQNQPALAHGPCCGDPPPCPPICTPVSR